MKIAVITLHTIKNYGSVLQTLATQELFERFGFEVEVINYIREASLKKNLLTNWCGKNPIKRIVMLPTIRRWNTVFNQFLDKYIHMTDKIYTYDEDFRQYPINADLYCTGSDQVWNTGWNEGIIKPLYLSFVPKDKFKFSYSSSFGKEELTSEEVLATKPYFEEYNYISVREDYAKKMIERYYNLNSVHVVDPTLAFDGDYWRKYKVKNKLKGNYILIYNLNRSKDFDDYALELSKRMQLPLVRLCTRYDQIFRVGKSILVPEVFEFITLIDDAKCVITDSFHATAFSLNLNTEPICVYPEKYSGRLASILQITDCLHRHLTNYSDFDIINRPIDFISVNKKLAYQREKTYNYLQKVIDGYHLYIKDNNSN